MNLSQETRDTFHNTGVLSLLDPEGKRLIVLDTRIIPTSIAGVSGKAVMVAYEGRGAYFWNVDTPMNLFVLIENGFDGNVATSLSRLLLALIRPNDGPPRLPNLTFTPR